MNKWTGEWEPQQTGKMSGPRKTSPCQHPEEATLTTQLFLLSLFVDVYAADTRAVKTPYCVTPTV